MSASPTATSSCSGSTFPARGWRSSDEELRLSHLSARPADAAGRDAATLSFETRRWQRGFRNAGNDTRLVDNGTFLNNIELAPAIGMDRSGLLQERAKRRKYGLPPELRPAKLEDLSATRKQLFRRRLVDRRHHRLDRRRPDPDRAGQEGLGRRSRGGRRTARFVSDAPILTFFSIQSARYAEKHRDHQGVDLAVYYHPPTPGTSTGCSTRCQASLDYYQANFGPYQFDQARIIEFPGYETFAQAFANTMPYSEAIGFVADTSRPRQDRLRHLRHRPRARPPILGPPGHRRRHAGRDHAVARRSPNIRR